MQKYNIETNDMQGVACTIALDSIQNTLQKIAEIEIETDKVVVNTVYNGKQKLAELESKTLKRIRTITKNDGTTKTYKVNIPPPEEKQEIEELLLVAAFQLRAEFTQALINKYYREKCAEISYEPCDYSYVNSSLSSLVKKGFLKKEPLEIAKTGRINIYKYSVTEPGRSKVLELLGKPNRDRIKKYAERI